MKRNKLAITVTTALLASELAAQERTATKDELARLEPAAREAPAMSAMCYEVAAPPSRIEYVCPVCGERSFHVEHETSLSVEELTTCRRLLTALPQREALTLDETALCTHCRPNETKRELALVVRYADGRSERASGVRVSDLALLAEVLTGQKPVDAAEVKGSILAPLTRLAELAPTTRQGEDR